MRLALADGYRADVDVTEIDMPTVSAFGISAAGELEHAPIEAPLGQLGKSH
jgi:hypothetical protein